jgi:hypothetical protein
MSLRVIVETYGSYTVNAVPIRFFMDDDEFDISLIEDRWQTPNAEYFKVRTTEGKHYLLRWDLSQHEWTLHSSFDGNELLARPGTELIVVGPKAIQEAVSRIAGCESCRGNQANLRFDRIIADVLDKHGPYEFIVTEPAYCQNCRRTLTEKTFVEPQGGFEVHIAS